MTQVLAWILGWHPPQWRWSSPPAQNSGGGSELGFGATPCRKYLSWRALLRYRRSSERIVDVLFYGTEKSRFPFSPWEACAETPTDPHAPYPPCTFYYFPPTWSLRSSSKVSVSKRVRSSSFLKHILHSFRNMLRLVQIYRWLEARLTRT